MKRLMLICAVSTAVFLLSVVAIRQTAAQHQGQAKTYVEQGLYDEALQSYHDSVFHLRVLRQIIYFFGEVNAYLATIGVLLILTGILLKDPRTQSQVKTIKITQDFRWKNF